MILGIDPIYIILLVIVVVVGAVGFIAWVMTQMRKTLSHLKGLPDIHDQLVLLNKTTSGNLRKLPEKTLDKKRLQTIINRASEILYTDLSAPQSDQAVYRMAIQLAYEATALKSDAIDLLELHQAERENLTTPHYVQQPSRTYLTPEGHPVHVYDPPDFTPELVNQPTAPVNYSQERGSYKPGRQGGQGSYRPDPRILSAQGHP